MSGPFSYAAKSPSVARCLWYLLNQKDETLEALPEEKEKFKAVLFVSSSSGGETADASESTYEQPTGKKRGSDDSGEEAPPKRSQRFKSNGITKDDLHAIDENMQTDLKANCKDTRYAMGKWRQENCTVVGITNADDLCAVVSALLALENLQGLKVPRMLAYGTYDGKPVLVLEPLTKVLDCKSLTHEEKRQMMEGVKAIHRAGYSFSEPIGAECVWKSCSKGQQMLMLPIAGLNENISKADIMRDSESLRSLSYD